MLNDWINKDKENFRDDLFEFCQKESNSILFKRLALSLKDKFDSESLGFAFIGSNSLKMLGVVEDLANKKGISLEGYAAQACNKNPELIEHYDTKWGIVDLKEEVSRHHLVGGKISRWACAGGPDYRSNTERHVEGLNKNVFLCCAKNEKALVYMLTKGTPNQSLIDNAFIQACVDSNVVSISVLLKNDNTRSMIENSSHIQSYLAEPTEDKAIKEVVKECLNSIKLKGKLEDDLTDKSSQSKMKI